MGLLVLSQSSHSSGAGAVVPENTAFLTVVGGSGNGADITAGTGQIVMSLCEARRRNAKNSPERKHDDVMAD
ncbi:unnamed protein product [Gadus morhua 'NCC']